MSRTQVREHKRDIVCEYDCLEFRTHNAMTPRRRDPWSIKQFIKTIRVDDNDDDTTVGTCTPEERSSSESGSRNESSKGTSPPASPPPESLGLIADSANGTGMGSALPRRKPAFRYSTAEDCVNDKVQFKRILRQMGQKAELKYRDIRSMFQAADVNGSGRLNIEETVELFAQFDLEAELASKFFNYIDKDGSGQIDWREFMAAFGSVFNEERSTTARDRRAVAQSYNTWRPVPGPLPGMMRMVLA